MHGLTCDRCDDNLLVASDVRYLMRGRSRPGNRAEWLGEPREWDLCPACQRHMLASLRLTAGPSPRCCRCDRAAGRYQLEVVLFAAYDVMEIPAQMILERDLSDQWDDLLDELHALSGEEAQDQIYRRFVLTVCSRCKFRWFHDPFEAGSCSPRGSQEPAR